jgi:molybdenum cofactor cytidylyltransferase
MASPESEIAVIVLAAGRGERFEETSGDDPPQGACKQLASFNGEPLVQRVCRHLLGPARRRVVVVLGHRASQVAEAVEDLAVETVYNPDFDDGQSTSVRCGLRAVRNHARAAAFVPVDQPFVDAALIERLVAAWTTTGAGIVVPRFGPRRGAPVLFDRRWFPALDRLTGDEGGRRLLAEHPEEVREVELEDELPLRDADTATELRELAALEDQR